MMKSVIFGLNDFAELLLYHIKRTSAHEICAFVVDKEYLSVDKFCELPVICAEEMHECFSCEIYGVYVCIGYRDMNQGRQKTFAKLINNGYEIREFIHPDAHVDLSSAGKGNIIFQNVVIDAYTSIGDGNIFYADSMVAHHSKIGNYNFFAPKSCVCGNVNIGDNCYFGAHSTVRNSVNVNDFTLIGANAYVSCNTEPYSVVVPAQGCVLENKSSLEVIL